ncbi:MAG: hypothetical protein NVS9B5_37500 [Terriglobales bacterium]
MMQKKGTAQKSWCRMILCANLGGSSINHPTDTEVFGVPINANVQI